MRDGPRCFGQNFSCSALLRCRIACLQVVGYGAVTLCGRPFQSVPLTFRCRFLSGPSTPTVPQHCRFGLLRVRSPLLAQSLLFSFPPGSEMFQFPGLASGFCRMERSPAPGSPIRISAVLWVFAPRHGFSQLVTSFFASKSLGILHVPFSPFLFLFYGKSPFFHTDSPSYRRASESVNILSGRSGSVVFFVFYFLLLLLVFVSFCFQLVNVLFFVVVPGRVELPTSTLSV